MKHLRFFLILSGIGLMTVCCASSNRSPDLLYQVSTINALLDGVYDGETTMGELTRHGDFGIGTFGALDGEMVGLDGAFFQIRSDGKAYRVSDAMQTPFAVVTPFEADAVLSLEKPLTYDELQTFLDEELPTKNVFYAIKIEGEFADVKARAPVRATKPYPPLVEALKDQPIFEFHDVKGTLVGFRSPDYVKGLNVPGYHFHFITDDRTTGGHLLECRVKNARVEIDATTDYYVRLPTQPAFAKAALSHDRQHEIEQVER